MSEIHLVSFATPDFEGRQRLLGESAVGLETVSRAVPVRRAEVLDSPYGREHRELLGQPRGAGYWAWKPKLILDALADVGPGGWVLYSDVGRWARILSHRLDPLIDWCGEAGQPFLPGTRILDLGPAYFWTKRMCAERFGFDEPRLRSFRQVAATWSLWSRSAESVRFLEEWFSLSHEPGLIDDTPSPGGEGPGFIDHRHDQSVLSCLVEREGLRALFDDEGPDGPTHRECKDLDWVLARLGAPPSGPPARRAIYRTRRGGRNLAIWLRNTGSRCRRALGPAASAAKPS